MAWNFSSDRPVYIQISERIKRAVLSGEYVAGEQIPSVRQLAMEAAVNPNTVQHAFSDLEDEGIIISKGTVGRFVTDDVQIIEACRKNMAEQLVKDFILSIGQLSVSKDEAVEMIKEVDI